MSRDRVGRRDFLRITSAGAIASAALTGAAPGRARAQGRGRALRIGYVSPQTGPLAGFGETDNFVIAGVSGRSPGG